MTVNESAAISMAREELFTGMSAVQFLTLPSATAGVWELPHLTGLQAGVPPATRSAWAAGMLVVLERPS